MDAYTGPQWAMRWRVDQAAARTQGSAHADDATLTKIILGSSPEGDVGGLPGAMPVVDSW